MLQKINETPGTDLGDYASKALDGLYLEFGVHNGGTINIIASSTKNKVYGFDSFEGLPEDWTGMHSKGHFACKIPENLPENVELVVGLFEDTLPKFIEKHKDKKVAFVHVDCDLYSSTKCIFDNLKDIFLNGATICFDELIDYGNEEEWKHHEWKAWHEFLEETNYKWVCLGKYGRHQVAFKIYK